MISSPVKSFLAPRLRSKHQMGQKNFQLSCLSSFHVQNKFISSLANRRKGYYCLSVICLWSIKTKEDRSEGQNVIFSHLGAIPPGVFMCSYHFRGEKNDTYSFLSTRMHHWLPDVINNELFCIEGIHFASESKMIRSCEQPISFPYHGKESLGAVVAQ